MAIVELPLIMMKTLVSGEGVLPSDRLHWNLMLGQTVQSGKSDDVGESEFPASLRYYALQVST
jgi:hypothetical protein